MNFAKRVFQIAGVYGVVVLVPQYFMEGKVGRDYPRTLSARPCAVHRVVFVIVGPASCTANHVNERFCRRLLVRIVEFE